MNVLSDPGRASRRPPRGRHEDCLRIGFVAGALAIAVNGILLEAADWMHIDIGHGGLLKLLHQLLDHRLEEFGLTCARNRSALCTIPEPIFKLGFHIAVGLLMALLYTCAVEPLLPQRLNTWLKGAVYALLTWLLNAAVVLPALGQGFAGSRELGVGGMVYFAFAHTVFFLLLARLTAYLRDRPARADGV